MSRQLPLHARDRSFASPTSRPFDLPCSMTSLDGHLVLDGCSVWGFQVAGCLAVRGASIMCHHPCERCRPRSVYHMQSIIFSISDSSRDSSSDVLNGRFIHAHTTELALFPLTQGSTHYQSRVADFRRSARFASLHRRPPHQHQVTRWCMTQVLRNDKKEFSKTASELGVAIKISTNEKQTK